MKAMKRTLCLLLVLATMCSLCAGTASAASLSAYECLSTSRYAKVWPLKTSGRITPYTGPDLRTPGTEGCPSKSAYIDCATDELWLYDVGEIGGKPWAKVSYPIGGNARRTAYIRLTDITANTHSVRTISTGKFLCSLRQNGSLDNRYYVARNDVVWLLSVSGNRVQLLYPTGTNGYRIAWANKADYEKACGTIDGMIDVTAQFAGKTITMKSVENGKWLCADANIDGAPLRANRDKASSWETFTVSKMTSDGWVGFKAHNGKYLSAMTDTTNAPINARYDNLYAWECFRIYQKGNDYYIKAQINNKWLCVRTDINGAPVQAYASAPLSWERIQINILADTSFSPVWPCETAYKVSTMYFYYYGGNVTRHSTYSLNTNSDGYLNGIDITGGGNVVAAEAGTVEYAGWRDGGFGNTVIIRHNNGLYSLYGHLNSIHIQSGKSVSKGQVIGVMGNTGNSDGTHLHFEMYGLDSNGNATIVDPFLTYYATKYNSKILIGDVSPLANKQALNTGYHLTEYSTKWIQPSALAREHINFYLTILDQYYKNRYW